METLDSNPERIILESYIDYLNFLDIENNRSFKHAIKLALVLQVISEEQLCYNLSMSRTSIKR